MKKNTIQEKVQLLKEKAKDLSVLYVEDEKLLREKTTVFLNKIFTHVSVAADGKEGLDKYNKNKYDIIITDILMPKMNGLEFVSSIRKYDEKQEIIITSAYTDLMYLTESIKLGVRAYLIKPLNFEDILKTLEHSVNKIQVFHEVQMYREKLELMVDERTKEVIDLQKKEAFNYENAIKSLVKMMELRDTYTSGHGERVAEYSKEIAKEYGLKKEECELVYQAGILHDIGKIITPDSMKYFVKYRCIKILLK